MSEIIKFSARRTSCFLRRRKLQFFSIVVTFFSISYVFADTKAAHPIQGAIHLPYKSASETGLLLNAFFPSDHNNEKDKRPAVIFFFGGGWNGGNPAQFSPHCQYLSSRGMVAMSADYRVKSRQGVTPFECVKDGKSAIRWVRQNADDLGIDPTRIAAGGGSAGGQVAAATGTVIGLEETGEELSVSSKPNAMILFNPVYDNGPNGFGYKVFGDRFREISPFHNIRKDTPPTIVFLGSEDKLVPVSTAKKFKFRMEKFGCRSDLHIYAGQPHGFFNHGKKGDYFSKTVLEMDKFLISLGWLNGIPKITIP